ncbi:phenylacetate--CoA ligase family protein [Candidatus Latescibacterota bacterium]
MDLYTKLKYLSQLNKQQWLSPAQLSEFRTHKLKRLITHAYERVPYYRRIFDEHGVTPQHIKNIEDLQKLPILTKQTLQRGNPTDFLAKDTDISRCIGSRTSGATGIPLTVFNTKNEGIYMFMTMVCAYWENKVRPWHKRAHIYDTGRMPKKWVVQRWNQRKIHIPPSQHVKEQIETLQLFRPHVICGFNNSLKLLAHALKQSGTKGISPDIVIGSAELLDEPTRALINGVFEVEMVDMYASAETGCIAWECPDHRGYHLNVDSLIVEFIRDGKPVQLGEPGHIVVTPLFRYAMPLIRYDLGDIGIPTDRQCSCGRGLPLMEMIKGRSDEFITLPSGTVIPPVATFAVVIENEPSIAEYFVVQENYDLIVVKLVIYKRFGADEVERVKSGIEDLVHHEAVVKVEVVDKIDRGTNDKYRRIISKVPLKF